jgi:hypothetical protein
MLRQLWTVQRKLSIMSRATTRTRRSRSSVLRVRVTPSTRSDVASGHPRTPGHSGPRQAAGATPCSTTPRCPDGVGPRPTSHRSAPRPPPHHLDDHTLAGLDARQQAIIADRPRFDPNGLHHTHRTVEALTRRSRADTDEPHEPERVRAAEQRVTRLEQSPQRHRGWAGAARKATDLRSQIAQI